MHHTIIQTRKLLGWLKRKVLIPFHRISSTLFGSSTTPPPVLNTTQDLFVEWNAIRLDISIEESKRRYFRSWQTLPDGHKGTAFRAFGKHSYDIYQVFFGDDKHELFSSYDFFGPMHFLRMLSYDDFVWADKEPLIQGTATWSEVRILDFGCGLAQSSRALALVCQARGQAVERLALADIPTIRRDFLNWLGGRTGLPIQLIDCTRECPLPPLPTSNIIIATEIFEHLYEPVSYLLAFHEVLEPGGYLYTQIGDHSPEYMHVSPSLKQVRQKLAELNYRELHPNRLFQKPGVQ